MNRIIRHEQPPIGAASVTLVLFHLLRYLDCRATGMRDSSAADDVSDLPLSPSDVSRIDTLHADASAYVTGAADEFRAACVELWPRISAPAPTSLIRDRQPESLSDDAVEAIFKSWPIISKEMRKCFTQ